MSKAELDVNAILIAEFNYVAQTAFQANEDRARASSFYLITVASLIAAIVGTQFENFKHQVVYFAFGSLFIGLSIVSIITVLQLGRFRRSWLESISVLNQIKQFYIDNGSNQILAEAFRWQVLTMPKKFKLFSISMLFALQVAMLGSIAFGSAAAFLALGVGYSFALPGIVLGIIFFIVQLVGYRLSIGN